MSLLLKALQRAQQQSAAAPTGQGNDHSPPATFAADAPVAAQSDMPVAAQADVPVAAQSEAPVDPSEARTHIDDIQLSYDVGVIEPIDAPTQRVQPEIKPRKWQPPAERFNSAASVQPSLPPTASEGLPDSYPAKLDAAIAAIESLRAEEAGNAPQPLPALLADHIETIAPAQATISLANVSAATAPTERVDPSLDSCAAALICHLGVAPFCVSIIGLGAATDNRLWQAGLAAALGAQLFGDVLLIRTHSATPTEQASVETVAVSPSDFLADDFDREQAITKTEHANLRELQLRLPLAADAQLATQLTRIVRDCKRNFQAVLIDCGTGDRTASQLGSIATAGDATVLAVPLGKIDDASLRDASALLTKIRAPRVACIAVQSAGA